MRLYNAEQVACHVVKKMSLFKYYGMFWMQCGFQVDLLYYCHALQFDDRGRMLIKGVSASHYSLLDP